MRVAIAGWPGTGKTTLARELLGSERYKGALLFHTDDYIDMGWSEASEHVAALLDTGGPLIVEGVAVPRALRKWKAIRTRDRLPTRPPVDKLIVLRARPRIELTRERAAMGKGHDKVLDELLDSWPALEMLTDYRV